MERIHVAVRSRPLPQDDAKTSPWRISGNSIFFTNHSSKFEFDRIFGDDCNNFEVYQACTKEIVNAAVRGFNGTVFAYGQTNSGKTYTMRGSGTEPGVIPLSVRDLFKTIQQDVDREFLLRMSYMEIYNEEINDLLAPEHRKLQIHESLERGIYVAGLREEIVASPEQVLDLMEFGESHRHIGETNMNLYSSRSHTIFRMIIESRDKSEDEDIGSSVDAVRVSVLNLVDLAGSERAAKTGAEGVRLKEGSHINKSLMTLGTVIKKLSEGAESQGGHVPYRDSKLTRILQPALGGNSNTAIICNITLAQIHADETKSSLQFASRALRVTNCARVNEFVSCQILTDAALLKRQKKEIEELRSKLQGSHSEHLGEEILNLRNTLLQTELERERIALELEEEKKAQAEWEKRVQEQAKKIESLSSMVLYSTRDENRDHNKKGKRRDTWCPGNLPQEVFRELIFSSYCNCI
ncbi:kinesin-like protein kin-7o [Fagus crenata]